MSRHPYTIQPTHCKSCDQKLPIGFWNDRKKKQGNSVRKSLFARAAKGLPIGRPRTRNDKEIQKLRREGFSIRKIAKILSTSSHSVACSIREMK